MTKRQGSGDRSSGPSDNRAGYGKPPKAGQIQPGEARNPSGHNGKLSPPDVFEAVMATPIKVKIDGRAVSMPTDRAIYMAHAAKAVQGHARATQTIGAERRKRRPAALTVEEVAEAAAGEARRQELSTKIISYLTRLASHDSATGWVIVDGELEPTPELVEQANKLLGRAA